MSTPARPGSLSSVHPTRQQLDELDALMQRMLALPVNQPEEEAGVIAESVAPPRPAAPSPRPPNTTARELPPSSAESRPARVAERSSTRAPVSAREGPRDVSVENPASPIAAETPAQSRREHRPPRTAWWLRPVVEVNRAFDRVTSPLGPLGRWLQGPVGRGLLGWAGLLLLATALAWGLLDWMGWTW